MEFLAIFVTGTLALGFCLLWLKESKDAAVYSEALEAVSSSS